MVNKNRLVGLTRRCTTFSIHVVTNTIVVALVVMFPCVSHGANQDALRINTNVHSGYCRSYIHGGRVFVLGALVRDVTLHYKLDYKNSSYKFHNTLAKGSHVVVAGSKEGQLCVFDINSNDYGWVPQSSINVEYRDTNYSKKSWAGVWAATDGTWMVLNANIDNSVTVLDGHTCLAGCKHVGTVSGLVSLRGRLQSGTVRFIDPDYDGSGDGAEACSFQATLLRNTLVVSRKSEACLPYMAFEGIYHKVEQYPSPAIKDYVRRVHSQHRDGKP